MYSADLCDIEPLYPQVLFSQDGVSGASYWPMQKDLDSVYTVLCIQRLHLPTERSEDFWRTDLGPGD